MIVCWQNVDVYVKVSIASFGLNHSGNGISCRTGRWRIFLVICGPSRLPARRPQGREDKDEQHFRPSERRQARQALACRLSRYRSGRDSAAGICLACRTARKILRPLRRPDRLFQHGQGDALPRTGEPDAQTRRLAAKHRPSEGRPRRCDDAERAAVPDRDLLPSCAPASGRERQPALYAARTRTPVEGFRRQGDLRAGEFRTHGRAGPQQDGASPCRRHLARGNAGAEGADRQFRRAQGEEARSLLVDPSAQGFGQVLAKVREGAPAGRR